MVPVMEDKLLAQRWAEGGYHTDDLLAYSAVCGTGLDTLPLPGDVSVEQLRRILGDVAALAWKWRSRCRRVQPVWGKKAGDTTEFKSQYLFNTTLHQAHKAVRSISLRMLTANHGQRAGTPLQHLRLCGSSSGVEIWPVALFTRPGWCCSRHPSPRSPLRRDHQAS